jgi:MarR family transcriptional regulator, transcriptional regulator for hemolysin
VLARLMRNNFDRVLSGANITRSQWGLIAVVARHPGSTQRTIAEALEMSEASAGRLIDRLCAEGLLELRERDDDRRARAVFLSPEAEPLLQQSAELARDYARTIFDGLDRVDLEVLERLLDRIHDNLGKTPACRDS